MGPAEKPRQRNAKRIAGSSERIRVALGLAGYAGLRLGELRGLRWGDIDFSANKISVRHSATPAGTFKEPKTDAGRRMVPLLPVLRRLLVAWKVRSPQTSDDDLVLCTVERAKPMEEKSLRRALDSAKGKAGLGETEERLSWHSLRHSFASMLATDLELAATTLARVTGHSDPGFTLRVYARDGREDQALVEDVLARATAAKVGG